MIRLEPKRPDEERRRRHSWADFLGTDTIATQTTTSSDVTVLSSSIDTDQQSVLFEIGGGTDGALATIQQSIVTAAGDKETETFYLEIINEEILTLGEIKEYLGLFTSDKDRSLMQMIPRARLWVEDHTGIALVRRQFVERLVPTYGAIRLSKGPLVSVDSVDYSGGTFTPTAYPPSTKIFGVWPSLTSNEAFEITYTAGLAAKDVDDRLRGAMFALIEGEFSFGAAYTDDTLKHAENCCAHLRQMVA